MTLPTWNMGDSLTHLRIRLITMRKIQHSCPGSCINLCSDRNKSFTLNDSLFHLLSREYNLVKYLIGEGLVYTTQNTALPEDTVSDLFTLGSSALRSVPQAEQALKWLWVAINPEEKPVFFCGGVRGRRHIFPWFCFCAVVCGTPDFYSLQRKRSLLQGKELLSKH